MACGWWQRATLLLLGCLLQRISAQQTLKLSPTLTLEKSDDKAKTHADLKKLQEFAKAQKLQGNVVRFLDNAMVQMDKVMDAVRVFEEKAITEVPKDFTPPKYRVKSMPKLNAKKITMKKMAATELRKRLREGKDLDFKEPLLVTNATGLFEDGSWDRLRRHWSVARIMADEYLEKNFMVEYWPPDKARARMVGSMLQMEEPDPISFSRYIINCFHGSPAKPMLPGQNTEHCEQTVDAHGMVHNNSELAEFNIFPEIKNAQPLQAEIRGRILQAGSQELPSILGKQAKKWISSKGQMRHRFFTFGPSGSGDKLHAENGLPFYDVLVHGSRRWLLLSDSEMEKVAAKAREALEFDKTSAYMFFEEKLPELKEEFGLKKYIEANQDAGDLIIVPSGWYRVSLALADSFSYYETILSDPETIGVVTDNTIWKPQFSQHQLAYCYDADELGKLPGMEEGNQHHTWLKNAIGRVKLDEVIPGILSNLLQCGSVLALEKTMPKLKATSVSTCTPAVWKRCRKQLVDKTKEKGLSVTLDWLPKEAPKSIDDIPLVSLETEKAEL